MRPRSLPLVLACAALAFPVAADAATIESTAESFRIDAFGDGGSLDVNITLTVDPGGQPAYLIRYSHFILDAFGDPGTGCVKIATSKEAGRGVRCARRAGQDIVVSMTLFDDVVSFNSAPGEPLQSAPLADPVIVHTWNGDDVVKAGAGPVTARLEDGDDTFVAGTAGGFAADVKGEKDDDQLIGGPGPDVMNGGDDNDTLRGGAGDDRLSGLGGNDRVSGEDGNDRTDGNDGFDTVAGGDGNDIMNGNADGDLVQGDNGDDEVVGGDGNDNLVAGAGRDVVRGQAGNDVLSDGTSAKDGADTFDGGLGFDRMSYVTRTAPLAALIDQTADDGELGENDNLIGIDSVTLGSGADRFLSFVDDGEDEVFGGAGNDVIRTGAGDDTLNGGTGVDELTAASGNDVISAQDGVKDTIACGDGTDTLFGDLQDATSTGCESKSLSPKGEPMPLLVKPRARVSGAKLVLDVECAKNHRSPCRGVMRVSGARATSFKVKAGKRAKLRVRLGAKRSGLVASLSEKGRKGTRTTEAALVLP